MACDVECPCGKEKGPAKVAEPCVSLFAPRNLPRGADLGEETLERLIALLGEVGVQFTELGRLGYETLVAGFDILALHLNRLLQRLGAEQLLERRATILEGLLRIVCEFARDRLPALRNGAELLHRDIDVIFAKLLDVFEILEHESPLSGPPHCASGPVSGLRLPAKTVPSGSDIKIYRTAPLRKGNFAVQ